MSDLLVERLRRQPHALPQPVVATADALDDDDLQLSLYLCYEQHYRGFAGVPPGWEWEPSLVALRRRLEAAMEQQLIFEAGLPEPDVSPAWALAELVELVSGTDGPSLSRHAAERADLQQLRELAVHRSAYQLKEADPHTWGLPRLQGAAKAAMAEIQADEYGGGEEAEMHSSLFAVTMQALGLDARYGRYLELLPASTLATVNLISLFGLHRRWRGALVGHLAAFEMTSVGPMSRYAEGLTRLGLPAAARRFYDVHVEADAGHAVIARDRLVAGLLAEEPELAADVVFGVRALIAVERRFSAPILAAWARGDCSLRQPVPLAEELLCR